MYIVKKWGQFRKDYKKIINDNSKKEDLKKVLNFLINWSELSEKYKRSPTQMKIYMI